MKSKEDAAKAKLEEAARAAQQATIKVADKFKNVGGPAGAGLPKAGEKRKP